jgi:rubredoxin
VASIAYNPRPLSPWPALRPFMKAYMCVICGYVFEEEKGDPQSGIAPGTRWDDVPLSWRCPDCGAGKEDFEMVEI